MRWSNKHNIDPAIASAVMLMEERGDVGDASITQVIQPPQIVALTRAHWDDIEEDVSDGLWRLMGRAMHHVVAEANTDNQLVEERLFVDADGWKISGQPDLWREPADLIDFKLTRVWAFLLGRKQDWEDQLNFYAVLYRAHGFSVQRLKISALLRDWQAEGIHEQRRDYLLHIHGYHLAKHSDEIEAENRIRQRCERSYSASCGTRGAMMRFGGGSLRLAHFSSLHRVQYSLSVAFLRKRMRLSRNEGIILQHFWKCK